VTKAGAAENQKNSRVVPLMIGWIIEATEQMNASDGDTIVIDDCEMGHMIVIGRIIDIDNQAGKTLITLEDTSGSIVIQINKRFDQSAPKILEGVDIAINKYIKAIFSVSKYKDQVVNVAVKLFSVQEGDAITEHNLKAILCQKHRRFGPLREEDLENNAYNNNNTTRNPAETSNIDLSAPLDQQIKNAIRRGAGAQTVEKISRALNNSNVDLIKETLETLMSAGEVFEEESGSYAMA